MPTLSDFGRNMLTAVLSAAMVAAPVPALASAPAGDEAAPAEENTPTGGLVALLRFEGEEAGAVEYREYLQTSLAEAGFEVKGIKRSGGEAAQKNKCTLGEDACHEKIAKYLNKNAKTPFDFYAYGIVPEDGGTGTIVVYDIGATKVVTSKTFTRSMSDQILPLMLPAAVTVALTEYQTPRPAITAEEQAIVDTLDEPEKTAEEIAAEKKAIQDAEAAGIAAYNASFDAGSQEVDLKKDFETYCRNGPREDKISTDTNGDEVVDKDMRPVCKRGPVFGYWQPKAFAVLGLTVGAAAATGALYGMALGARGEWSKAKSDLEDSGLTPDTPDECSGDVCYTDLAMAVSEAQAKVRRRAIIGDALLGTTAVMAGLLTIIIFQERSQAKRFLQEQKELNISDLRVGPMMGAGSYGASAGFSF